GNRLPPGYVVARPDFQQFNLPGNLCANVDAFDSVQLPRRHNGTFNISRAYWCGDICRWRRGLQINNQYGNENKWGG
ncbi:hypothetical protein HPX83_005571, partial [Salmonella enterica]|nr:hypothetical protein [Salmonella enterica]